MMHIMTADDVARSDARIGEIARGNLEDRITALLMAIEIGGHGMYESGARKKASAIMCLITQNPRSVGGEGR